MEDHDQVSVRSLDLGIETVDKLFIMILVDVGSGIFVLIILLLCVSSC